MFRTPESHTPEPPVLPPLDSPPRVLNLMRSIDPMFGSGSSQEVNVQQKEQSSTSFAVKRYCMCTIVNKKSLYSPTWYAVDKTKLTLKPFDLNYRFKYSKPF